MAFGRKAMMLCAVMASPLLAGQVHVWEKSGSIPVRATVHPAVPDRTSPVSPSSVEVPGLLGE